MMTVKFDNDLYYDISTYGVDEGIYSESDYNRLKNVHININDKTVADSIIIYYTNKPFFRRFLSEKVSTKKFYGNPVCFITSKDDAQLRIKENIVLPTLKTENISKIIIKSKDNEDVSLESETEISRFIGNIDYNLEMLSIDSEYQECQVYYKNTDADIYEIINNDTIKYLQ